MQIHKRFKLNAMRNLFKQGLGEAVVKFIGHIAQPVKRASLFAF